MDSAYQVSQNDLSSEVMSCRRIRLLGVCFVLLQAVTASGEKCLYNVKLTTGNRYRAGTDDKIMIRIHEKGKWHSLDNPNHDDFESGNTDTFAFKDDCIDSNQQTTIGSAGHGRFFVCFSDAWLVTHVWLISVDHRWMNGWFTHKWLSCHDTLKLNKLADKHLVT